MNLIGFQLKHRAWYPWLWAAWLLLVFVTGAYVINQQTKEVTEVFFSVAAGVAGFIYFLYKQHLEETRLFAALFKQFNKRFDKLNNDLNRICNVESDDLLREEDRQILYDYFNLSAEEYMYFKAGYIDPEVWSAWLEGMRSFSKVARVYQLWAEELKYGSYYGFNIDLLKH